MGMLEEDAEILLLDAGNSFLKLAFANCSGISGIMTLPSSIAGSADCLGITLLQLMCAKGVDPQKLRACVACSVVPRISKILRGALESYICCPLLMAPDDLAVPLENMYDKPQEAGIDRLVAAWGARTRYRRAKAIVLADFGSVATFDCIDGTKWLGGLLFPGPLAALSGMLNIAPALPHIRLDSKAATEMPDCAPRKDTRSAMRSGILHGFGALAEGLCKKLAENLPKPRVILATGGFAEEISHLTTIFDGIIPNLVLEGLASLYYEKTDLHWQDGSF